MKLLTKIAALAATAGLLCGAALVASNAAGAATGPSGSASENHAQAGRVNAPEFTRGFDFYNLSGTPLRLSSVTTKGDVDGPKPGDVLQPGGRQHFELTWWWNQSQDRNTATLTWSPSGRSPMNATISVNPYRGTPFWAAAQFPSGSYRLEGTSMIVLDPPGTVHDIPAGQGQAQADTLNQLCTNGSTATCDYTNTSESILSGAEKQIGPAWNNLDSPLMTHYDVSRTDTRSFENSIGVDLSASGKLSVLGNEIETTVTAKYHHTWTESHDFTAKGTLDVPGYCEAWITDAPAMIRYTGDITITMGNTTWRLHDVYVDTPDPAGNGVWHTHATGPGCQSGGVVFSPTSSLT